MSLETTNAFATILAGLQAAGEETRLRLLAVLGQAELTVSELVNILGQSQPRVSRHLKLLTEAGIVDRHREGAWAFFSVAEREPLGGLVRGILARLDPEDPVLAADRLRLADARRERADQAATYFAAHARDWDRIRSLHVPETRVETAICDAVGSKPLHALLDIGTGTGRILELLAPLAARGVGVDQSAAMLALARDRLERANQRNVQLRQGDIYALPVESNGYDLVVVHQVLHYLDDPSRAVRQARRTVRPGGRLLVIDFAPHEEEFLRRDHAHRRLGFGAEEIAGYMRDAGLEPILHRLLAPGSGEADKLTVSMWMGRDTRILGDSLMPAANAFEVA